MLRAVRSAFYSRLYAWACRRHEASILSQESVERNVRRGRKWYGNDVGFFDNLRGALRMHWASACSGYRSPDPAATARPVEELRTQGYTTLTNLFDPALVQAVYAKYGDMIGDDNYSIHRTQGSRMLLAAHHTLPGATAFLSDYVFQVIQDYYQSYCKVIYSGFYRNWHLPPDVRGKEAYSNFWHSDRMPSDILSIMINLHDTTEDHGPFHIVSYGRTTELLRMGWQSRTNYHLPPEVMEDPKHVVKLTGAPGSVMISNNQWCLHRASVPGPNRIRDVGSFQVEPSLVPLPKNWENDIKLSVPEQALWEKKKHLAHFQKTAA